MKELVIGILFIIWLIVTLLLAVSFVGLVVVCCTDWIDYGNILLKKL